MNKKKYEAPVVKRVKLEIKSTILSECFSSMIVDPNIGLPCKLNPDCSYEPPI